MFEEVKEDQPVANKGDTYSVFSEEEWVEVSDDDDGSVEKSPE
jgi:hypothetical protein